MHPALYEALILAVMGISGVGAGLLFGVRRPIPLAISALAATTVLRVWSAFAAWSFGIPELNFEVWLGASAGVAIVASFLQWRHWRQAAGALALFGGLSVVALSTKYLFDIGERHHSDISKVLGVALVVVQGDLEDLSQAAGSYKRGIAYPLMLALGPEGRILGGFTPLVFLMILLLAGWLARQLLPASVSTRVIGLVGLAVGIFSVTVPIFRAAMFYLNGHTLMSFGTLLLVGGLLLARRDGHFGPIPAAFVLFGGVIGVTARIEGVVMVLVVIAALAGQRFWSDAAERVRLFAVLALTGLSLTWWISSLQSPVLDRVGLPTEALAVLVLLSVVGAALAASPWVDSLRRFFLPAVAVVLGFLLARQVWQSGDPLGLVLAQWPNLGLGAGGWGTAAHVFVASVILLGLRRRSSAYRLLVALSVLLIGAILYSKTFDGGFGREGFYDSVNRMWLHVMPTILLTTLVGYSEVLHNALRRGTHKKSSSGRKEKLAAAN